MRKYKKCDKNKCCEALTNRLEDYGKKGFFAVNTIGLYDKADSVSWKFRGVAYKTSAKDKGLMLNWCPFCGGQPGHFKRE